MCRRSRCRLRNHWCPELLLLNHRQDNEPPLLQYYCPPAVAACFLASLPRPDFAHLAPALPYARALRLPGSVAPLFKSLALWTSFHQNPEAMNAFYSWLWVWRRILGHNLQPYAARVWANSTRHPRDSKHLWEMNAFGLLLCGLPHSQPPRVVLAAPTRSNVYRLATEIWQMRLTRKVYRVVSRLA